jgi:hypothetical protein
MAGTLLPSRGQSIAVYAAEQTARNMYNLFSVQLSARSDSPIQGLPKTATFRHAESIADYILDEDEPQTPKRVFSKFVDSICRLIEVHIREKMPKSYTGSDDYCKSILKNEKFCVGELMKVETKGKMHSANINERIYSLFKNHWNEEPNEKVIGFLTAVAEECICMNKAHAPKPAGGRSSLTVIPTLSTQLSSMGAGGQTPTAPAKGSGGCGSSRCVIL